MTIDLSVQLRSRRLTGPMGAVQICRIVPWPTSTTVRWPPFATSCWRTTSPSSSATSPLIRQGHLAFATRLGPLTLGIQAAPAHRRGSRSLRSRFDRRCQCQPLGTPTSPSWTVRRSSRCLRTLIIPEVGGDTLWADTVAAYGDLPEDHRDAQDRLVAVHSNGHDYGRVDVAKMRGKLRPRAAGLTCRRSSSEVYGTEHPVVRLHPGEGARASPRRLRRAESWVTAWAGASIS